MDKITWGNLWSFWSISIYLCLPAAETISQFRLFRGEKNPQMILAIWCHVNKTLGLSSFSSSQSGPCFHVYTYRYTNHSYPPDQMRAASRLAPNMGKHVPFKQLDCMDPHCCRNVVTIQPRWTKTQTGTTFVGCSENKRLTLHVSTLSYKKEGRNSASLSVHISPHVIIVVIILTEETCFVQ